MKIRVMLDKNNNVTEDPEQSVMLIETEYDEQGDVLEETVYYREGYCAEWDSRVCSGKYER